MKIGLRALEPRWILSISFFIAGIFLGGLGIYIWTSAGITGLQKIHLSNNRFKYINPTIAVEAAGSRAFLPNKSLQIALSGLVDQAQKDGRVTHASVYFRDIEPGFWAGVDENGMFSPGKMLKIPIMVAYYRLAEADPNVLEQQLLMDGKFYSVDELISKMIVDYSDDAANVLFDNIDKTSLNEVFSDLGINFKEDKNTQDFIPLRLYALFFRVLYNSTYLSDEFSEKAMTLLVKTENKVGFAVTLSKNLAIANREGIRTFETGGTKMYEIYDCGVIFYPGHPYLLCAAAQSKDGNKLKVFFQSLGELAYKEMSYECPQ